MILRWTHRLVEWTWPILLVGMVIATPLVVKKTWDKKKEGR